MGKSGADHDGPVRIGDQPQIPGPIAVPVPSQAILPHDGPLVEAKPVAASDPALEPGCREMEVNSFREMPTLPADPRGAGVGDHRPPQSPPVPRALPDPRGETRPYINPPSYSIGDVIQDRFTVLEVLGAGGQGITVKCWDKKLPLRPVVLKCVRDDGFDAEANREQRKRLTQEASCVAALSECEHVPGVYDTFEAREPFCICFQYIAGRPLSRVISERRLDAAAALTVCLHIALALEAAHHHRQPIIHRDVKPANVMVDEAGRGWLIDFGYARFVNPSDGASASQSGPRTNPGRQPGTIQYMSPEQRDGEVLDVRSDVWSLGCVLFECLTGQPAFKGFCEFDDLEAPRVEWTLLERLSLPAGVRTLVADCLRLHRRYRPDVSRIADDLRRTLHELRHPSARAEPPSLSDNLPRANPLFCGRDDEVEKLRRMVLAPDASMVTITRTDGMGKSILAIETARALRPECPGGVWLVDAHAVTDRAGLIQGIAQALDLGLASTSSIERELATRTKLGRVLLVLDGCDRLPSDGPAYLRGLLNRFVGLRVLATCSVHIDGDGFTDFPLKPLRVPPERDSTLGTEQLRSYGAVELFYRIARQRFPECPIDRSVDAATIGHICRLVHGMPLAISLLAPLVGCMSLSEIAESLAQGGLGADANPILLRTFRSSHESLSEPERELLGRLIVFESGWTTAAAKEVCADPADAPAGSPAVHAGSVQSLLVSLFNKSMIEHRMESGPGAPGRYFLLAPIRMYVQQTRSGQRSGDELAPFRERHLRWFEKHVTSMAPQFDEQDQASRLAELHLDVPNILAALAHSKSTQPLRQVGLRLAAGMRYYWFVRGPATVGLAWLDEFAPDRLLADPETRARVANAAGTLAERCGKWSRARTEYEAALRHYRDIHDRAHIAGLLNNLGTVCGHLGDWETSRQNFEECIRLQTELGDDLGVAKAQLNYSSQLIDVRRSYAEAEARLLAALPHLTSDKKRHAMLLNNLGECEQALARPGDALRHYVESCREKQRLSNYVGWLYTNGRLVTLLSELGAHELAACAIGLGQYLRGGGPQKPDDVKAEEEPLKRLSEALPSGTIERLVEEGRDESKADALFDAILKLATALRG